MTQTFLAPGDPSGGTFYLSLGFQRRDLPFHSGTYLINGVEIARVIDPNPLKGRPQYVSGTLSQRELKAFRYGTNKLTIRVQKTALKKGEPCGHGIGVIADLSVTFRPDLVAVPSKKGLEQAVRKKAGEVVGSLGEIAFVNRGPSGSPGGKLIFQIGANVGLMTAWGPGTIQTTAPFHSCKGEGVGLTGELTCEYGDFPVGKRVSLFVVVAARVANNFPADGTTDLSLSWTIYPAGSDTNQVNNHTSHKFIVCGTASKDPRCKNAK